MRRKRKAPIKGSPEELRDKARRCAAKALTWLKKGDDFEKAARRAEKKRDDWERDQWPEQFCKTCVAGKPCPLHPKKEGITP